MALNALRKIAQGGASISLGEAVEAITANLTCTPKRRRERAQEALNGIQQRGLVRVDGDEVWIVDSQKQSA